MTPTLSELLKEVASPTRRDNEFLASYEMLRNPFPPARTIYPEVIYNQQEALTKFAQGMGDIIGVDIERRSLAILGGTGQGNPRC
jgi:hypothetical protein